MLSDSSVLPQLRPELIIDEVAIDATSAVKQWRLHDPIRQRYFLLAEGDISLLVLWPLSVVASIKKAWKSTNPLGNELQFITQLQDLVDFLQQNQLVLCRPGKETKELAESIIAASRKNVFFWVRKWMSWQIPLVNPQRFLLTTLPYVRHFWSVPCLILYTTLAALGLYLVTRNWEEFITTFSDFSSVSGFAAYAIALTLLKIIHELGHGYACVSQGANVSSMGIFVIYGFPMLYTDTSAAQRLEKKSSKLWIGGAGMIVEVVLASLATLLWAILPEGDLRSVCFVVATSSWLMTLAINLNPFGKFDGYYLLSDGLKFPNLHERGLAQAGWLVDRILFNTEQHSPESIDPIKRTVLAAYGVGVWLFYFSLGLAAAAITYNYFFTVFGIVIAAITLWLSVVKPIFLKMARVFFIKNMPVKSFVQFLVVIGIPIFLLFFPLDRTVEADGVLTWKQEQVIAAPEIAEIDKILITSGARVSKEDILFELSSPQLKQKHAEAVSQQVLTSVRIDRIAGDVRDRRELLVLEQLLAEAEAAVSGIELRKEQLVVRAKESGIIVDIPFDLSEGMWVRPDQPLGKLLSGSVRDAHAYVEELDIHRLSLGSDARFIPHDPSLSTLTLQLENIDQSAAESITPELLSSVYGGPIRSRLAENKSAIPTVSLYRARLSAVAIPETYGARIIQGKILISAKGVSLFDRFWYQIRLKIFKELSE